MTVGTFDISKTIKNAQAALDKDKTLSESMRALITVLITIIQLMAERIGKNSKNSSKPPSQDQNRTRGTKNKKTGKKAGGQQGREGKTLEFSKNPDVVIPIAIDRRSIPKGEFITADPELRQVVDIIITKQVTEYQAEVLIDSKSGQRYTSPFPENVNAPVQYGATVRGLATYLSLWQLLPYERVCDFFSSQADINISPGTIYNINQEAFQRLEQFETISKFNLTKSKTIHSDETGINVGGKTIWLHSASSDLWTLFYPHYKRGNEAMDEIGILPKFKGNLIHDCWSAYFSYECTHGICNAHILRELTAASENFKQEWAKKMEDFLIKLNDKVKESNGVLSKEEYAKVSMKYDKIIIEAEKECPLPEKPPEKKRGKPKKSKPRNLLERLIEHKNAVLLFAADETVPFTNNRAENEIRMTKVQQKISGCFRSIEGAKIFCRVRSYLLTCQKHSLSPSTALSMIFEGQLPDFIKKNK